MSDKTVPTADEPGDTTPSPPAEPGSERAAEESGNSTASAEGTVESTESEAVAAEKVSSWWRSVAGRRGSTVGLRAAAVLVLAAAVGSSVHFYLQDRDHREVLAAQAQARDAACAYGPVVSTYDSKHLDRYVHDVLAGATGDWRKQFESNSKDLSDVLAKGEVVAKSTDVQCAIKSGDEHSAEAIVVIGQTITSLGTQGKPEPGQLSTVMRLQKQGDHWLVDKISTPLSPLPPQP